MSSSTSEPLRCGNCNASPANNPKITLMACSRCQDKHYCNKDCQAAAWSFHKANCKRLNYKLKFHLCPSHIKDPAVYRILSVPATTTFHALHLALQIAFGWANTHAYGFAVKTREFKKGGGDLVDYIKEVIKRDANGGETSEDDSREYMVRISPIRAGYKIDKMHEGRRKHPRTVEKHAQQMKLWQVFDNKEYKGKYDTLLHCYCGGMREFGAAKADVYPDKEIMYVYGFVDNWEHMITVEGRTKATDLIVCIDGSGHDVAEDVESDRGWEELKEAYHAVTPNRHQLERRRWYETMASNGDPLGLGNGQENEWRKATINQKLAAAGL